MEILITLIVGGVMGWLASIVMKTNGQMGIVANVVIGILGSGIGHWLFGALGLLAYGPVGGIVVNIAGAMVLIAVLRALGVYR
jgi:uncharacterized membrane protein YeaQ/YmgE (transglycosylase-associated protein family)